MNAVVTVSVILGILTYGAFFVFCFLYWLRGVTGLALLLAAGVTLTWLSSPLFTLTRDFYLTLEPLVLLCWSFLLIRALGIRLTSNQSAGLSAVAWAFAAQVLLAVIAVAGCLAAVFAWVGPWVVLVINLCLLVINVLGLVFVEQLMQNSVADFRWRIRYLAIALGLMFGFGMVHHAFAILFDGPVLVLSAVQPGVMALIVPLVVIASLRNRTQKLRFSLSRNFVFQTGVLVATGCFLLLLGLFGYLAQIFAGDIGLTVAVFIAMLAVAFLFVVIGSSRFRSLLRVLLAKTFYEYRYDYRDERMKVTAQLTEPDPDFDLAQQAQRAILSVLHANRSCLWTVQKQQNFLPLSHIEARAWAVPLPVDLSEAIATFYKDHDWVLDLSAMPETAADIGRQLNTLEEIEHAGYLVPLFLEDRLFGVALIGTSEIPMQLSWEDYDIIKLISKQGAGFLALQEANRNLVETEQLTAVSQMSAFLLHDIKTIAAQLSLMLDNAAKHRDNPAFIDDMLSTTRNSVERMQRIIAGLRTPESNASAHQKDFDASQFLKARREQSTAAKSSIQYTIPENPVLTVGDPEALDTALTHLEQNACEAAGAEGKVEIRLYESENWVEIQVCDSGPGMTESFIQKELFAPFRSTKGLSGMGIGAYQARDRIRNCGGDLRVESKVGVGTTFTTKLPLGKPAIDRINTGLDSPI